MTKITDTDKEVNKMKQVISLRRDELLKLDTESKQEKTKIEQMDNQISEKKVKLDKMLEESIKMEELCAKNFGEIESKIAEVGPQVEAAKKQLSEISSKDIALLKTMNNPNPAVKKAVCAFCILLGNNIQNDDFNQAKTWMVKNTNVNEIVTEIMANPAKISSKVLDKLRSSYLNDKDFMDEAKMKNAYKPAAIFASFVKCAFKYVDIMKN